MTNEKLKEIIRNHDLWLNNEDGGERADLREANLRGANLRGANLREADLWGANLREADLWGADLREADLRGANLREADLRGANLRGANLREADLRGANLREANLRGANLWGADLREADLWGARGCYQACPCEGEFIAWKKCRTHGEENSECIVKLLIPADAKRSSATTEKCRADKAIVLEIQDLYGNKIDRSVYSTYEDAQNFEYKVGETVTPREPFDEDRWNECSSGIHFFIDRRAAVDY